jgi:hypothetical protein
MLFRIPAKAALKPRRGRQGNGTYFFIKGKMKNIHHRGHIKPGVCDHREKVSLWFFSLHSSVSSVVFFLKKAAPPE